MRFDGKTVAVTGGTGALGEAVVARIVAEGGRCFVPVHRRKEGAAGDKAQADPRVVFVEGVDLTDEQAVERFYREAQQSGPLWASIHTAGGFAMGKVEAISKGDFVGMMQINALSTFLCCREAVKGMRAGGGGRIVNVAAKPAVAPVGGMIAYSASKAAVASITQSLAAEVVKDGILVNAVLPSVMDTPANRKAFPPGTDYAKWPKVEQVAEAILFLAGPDNHLTSGALLPVYGKA
jgi:NAD(P)-dependent dehydrogenase (short-subunit alcohol dehydrogenase family)